MTQLNKVADAMTALTYSEMLELAEYVSLISACTDDGDELDEATVGRDRAAACLSDWADENRSQKQP